MSFPSLQLTDAGRQIIVKALSGECAIEFTKFGVGSGDAPANVNALTVLINSVKDIGINDIKSGNGCANLTGTLDNANLETGFWWTEIGIFATDPDDGEVLYAYSHAGEYAEYIPAYSNQSYLRTTLNVTVVVGDAENVDAIIGEYAGYVTWKDLEEHTGAKNNPHGVTKEQVGLGNVPNVTTNDQTPSFTAAEAVSEIVSGEKLSVLFGKIKVAISSLISHFNASNPHKITCGKIGAAEYATGKYTGTGTYGAYNPSSLTFDNIPKLLIVMPKTQVLSDSKAFVWINGVSNISSLNSIIQFKCSETSVSWYSSTNADDQLNTDGATYIFFALF